ncbi:hypothetical protein L873DRAFT_1844565 [Choiromyces venosus 120613-1]|uniref:Uncharacterized protein n=1 Tax=Choiromyces venosus 120613-1 TaxID=1336337 RepID=A0A3N4JHL3_9PEZI|nr:hypothetical protein L873DRAFT_1844565 [Choiromyces venosus 120613-1]
MWIVQSIRIRRSVQPTPDDACIMMLGATLLMKIQQIVIPIDIIVDRIESEGMSLLKISFSNILPESRHDPTSLYMSFAVLNVALKRKGVWMSKLIQVMTGILFPLIVALFALLARISLDTRNDYATVSTDVLDETHLKGNT